MKKPIKYDHAEYLNYLIPVPELRKSVDAVAYYVRHLKFDTIAFRGMSGALIAPPLAMHLQKELLMVRVPRRNLPHSELKVEGNIGSRHYLIVDDMISSGVTAIAIQREIKKVAPKAKCIGIAEVNLIREAYVEADGYYEIAEPYRV